jgi:hypothetical protein
MNFGFAFEDFVRSMRRVGTNGVHVLAEGAARIGCFVGRRLLEDLSPPSPV